VFYTFKAVVSGTREVAIGIVMVAEVVRLSQQTARMYKEFWWETSWKMYKKVEENIEKYLREIGCKR
jgi:hypothetical protein